MDDALELAGKLGNAIARSDRFRDLREAEAGVMANPEAIQKLSDRDAILKTLHEKEQAGLPIEPDRKSVV